MRSVWYSETSHPVRMSPLCKMSLEGLRSFVYVITANLAVITDVQAMQFIQPVWNWLEKKIANESTQIQKVYITFPSHPKGKFLGL